MPTSNTEAGYASEFTPFMRAYQDMVFSTAARLSGDDRQAEDIAQEVFIKAYAHFERLRGSPTAGGWLKTVATNLTLNYLTRYKKRWRLFSDMKAPDADAEADRREALEPPQPDTLLADIDAVQRRRAIDAAIRRLPEHQRVPLVLYHFEELSYEQIAARLGVSLAKIKTDIHRARAALLPFLEASGVDRHGIEN